MDAIELHVEKYLVLALVVFAGCVVVLCIVFVAFDFFAEWLRRCIDRLTHEM